LEPTPAGGSATSDVKSHLLTDRDDSPADPEMRMLMREYIECHATITHGHSHGHGGHTHNVALKKGKMHKEFGEGLIDVSESLRSPQETFDSVKEMAKDRGNVLTIGSGAIKNRYGVEINLKNYKQKAKENLLGWASATSILVLEKLSAKPKKKH